MYIKSLKKYKILNNLLKIKEDILFIDRHGVLHAGDNKIKKKIVKIIKKATKYGKKIIQISNTQTTSQNNFDLPTNTHLITSGDIFKHYVESNLINKMFKTSAKRLFIIGEIDSSTKKLLVDHKITIVDTLLKSDAVLIASLRNNMIEHIISRDNFIHETKIEKYAHGDTLLDDLSQILTQIIKLKIPVFVVNGDTKIAISVNHKTHTTIGPGYIAKQIRIMSNDKHKIIYFGKPGQLIYEYAANFYFKKFGKKLNKKNTVMIDDSFGTGIIGGNKFGINTCLNIDKSMNSNSAIIIKKDKINKTSIFDKKVFDQKNYGTKPTYILKKIG